MNKRFVLGLVVVVAVAAGLGYFAVLKKAEPPPIQATPTDDTLNWHTLRIEGEGGLEIKYPSSFTVSEFPEDLKHFLPYEGKPGVVELVDMRRGCYIGPLDMLKVDLVNKKTETKTIQTRSGKVDFAYMGEAGRRELIFSSLLYVNVTAYTSLRLTSTSNSSIQNKTWFQRSAPPIINESCITDFENIVASLRVNPPFNIVREPNGNPPTFAQLLKLPSPPVYKVTYSHKNITPPDGPYATIYKSGEKSRINNQYLLGSDVYPCRQEQGIWRCAKVWASTPSSQCFETTDGKGAYYPGIVPNIAEDKSDIDGNKYRSFPNIAETKKETYIGVSKIAGVDAQCFELQFTGEFPPKFVCLHPSSFLILLNGDITAESLSFSPIPENVFELPQPAVFDEVVVCPVG